MPKPVNIDFDWDEIEKEGAFELLPIGPYTVAITKLELKDSKKQLESNYEEGYPYINVELSVIEGEHNKRKVWDIWSLDPKAIPFGLARALPAFGVSMKGKSTYDDYTTMTAELFPKLLGQKAIAIVKHDQSPGYEPSERVNSYRKLGAVQTTASPASVI